VWELRYDQVIALNLVDRIVAIEDTVSLTFDTDPEFARIPASISLNYKSMITMLVNIYCDKFCGSEEIRSNAGRRFVSLGNASGCSLACQPTKCS
jgi:hypothetical protein